ncbi:MAG: glutamate 5-kinase [Clostridiales bacterium]|nr:glutamate 5-kinase [Clostridiales bacterium]
MNLQERVKNLKTIVVKVGTSTLTYESGRLNLKRIERLAWVLADIKNQGKNVILVSSGAIGVGSVRLGFSERPKQIKAKQAAAAVGQAVLMQIYQNFFNEYNQKVAQVLLTKEDFKEGERVFNMTNTFETLMEYGVIPIVNANDTISTFEIGFSDNDRLSAEVAGLVGADLLLILSDIDCLYDKDPKNHIDAQRVPLVHKITEKIEQMAGTNGSTFSTGGMSTKIAAGKICERNQIDMVVANGEDPAIIHRILEGKEEGTFFALRQE